MYRAIRYMQEFAYDPNMYIWVVLLRCSKIDCKMHEFRIRFFAMNFLEHMYCLICETICKYQINDVMGNMFKSYFYSIFVECNTSSTQKTELVFEVFWKFSNTIFYRFCVILDVKIIRSVHFATKQVGFL